jgi:hypothetical protein
LRQFINTTLPNKAPYSRNPVIIFLRPLRAIFLCIGAHATEFHNTEELTLLSNPNLSIKNGRFNQIDEIVIAIDDRRKAMPLKELLDCKALGVQIKAKINA